MTITRRQFERWAFSTAVGGALASRGTRLLAQGTTPVAFQPFAAQVARLLTALDNLGTPLPSEQAQAVRKALIAATSREQAAATVTIESLLDAHALLEVELNPEMRIVARRGAASPDLYQGGWRTFLVKVRNHAAATPVLTIKSPQGGSMGRRSSLAITGVHDFTNGAVDAVEARRRWLAIDNPSAPPMTAALSGLVLEYRIVELYSRDAGEREASLQAMQAGASRTSAVAAPCPFCFTVHPLTPCTFTSRMKPESLPSLPF